MTDAPANIRAHQAEQTLEVAWDDGLTAQLPYRYLRGECPCASCRNEWTGERMFDPATLPADLRIEGMEAIGNYAVRVSWSDGHASGLYSWDTLRRLAQECPT
jgi:DUF971 family protein